MKKSGKWILSAAVVSIAAAVTAYFVKNRSQGKQDDDLDAFDDFDDADEEQDKEEEPASFSREYVSLNRAPQAAPAKADAEEEKDTKAPADEEVTVSDTPSPDTIAEEDPGQA